MAAVKFKKVYQLACCVCDCLYCTTNLSVKFHCIPLVQRFSNVFISRTP